MFVNLERRGEGGMFLDGVYWKVEDWLNWW